MASTEKATVKSTPVAPQLGSPELNETLQARVEVAEKLLRESLMEGEPFLTDKISHLAIAGGKRFRVVFTLLAAMYGEKPTSEDVYKAAVVVELTHLATLYHDDVMDEADRRRGADSANMRWGNSIAILAGDYLFAVASDMLADLGSATVSHFAATFRELVTGQMRETVGYAEGQDPIDHYMTVIQEKTGVLIAAAGFLGAEHSGAPAEVRDSLHSFGRNMGQVFQIVDDIIDIWSDPKESGKVPGTDLREGVFTLPVLYAMQQEDEVGKRLREILTGPVEDDELVAEALELIKRSEGRQRAEEQVEHYRNRAEADLDKLPDSVATDALRELLGFSLKRLG